MIRKIKPLVAALTTVTFVLTQALTPLPQAHAQSEVLNPASRIDSGFNFNIPADLGTIETIRSGQGPAIIHIQTAHGNFEAQKKIAAILHYLKDQYGFKTLLLEGSAFKLDPEMLRFFPGHPAETMAVNEALAKKAIVKGPELFLLEENEAAGYGIEELSSYRANVKAFREVLRAKSHTENFLENVNLQIERLTAPYLNPELKAFIRRLDAWETAGVPLETRLTELKDAAAKYLKTDLTDAAWQLNWPMLVRLFKLREIEKRLDLTAYEKEKERFLTVFRQATGDGFQVSEKTDVLPLNSDTRNLTPGTLFARISALLATPLSEHHLSDPETGRLFEGMAAKLPPDFDYKEYPQVTSAITHIILRSELHGAELMQEVERLTGRILDQLAETAKEKEIVKALRDYSLLKKLFALELVPGEYEKIKKGPKVEGGGWKVNNGGQKAVVNDQHKLKQVTGAEDQVPETAISDASIPKTQSQIPNADLLSPGTRSLTPDSSVPSTFDLPPSASSLRPSALIARLTAVNADGRVRDIAFDPAGLEALDALFDKAMEFYGGTQRRDVHMLENIEKKIEELSVNPSSALSGPGSGPRASRPAFPGAVVITGGFHADPFGEHFAARGWNYALISPKITDLSGREEYLKIMMGQGLSPQGTVPESIVHSPQTIEKARNKMLDVGSLTVDNNQDPKSGNPASSQPSSLSPQPSSATVESAWAALRRDHLAASVPSRNDLLLYLRAVLGTVLTQATGDRARWSELTNDFLSSKPARTLGLGRIERAMQNGRAGVRVVTTNGGFLSARLKLAGLFLPSQRTRVVEVRDRETFDSAQAADLPLPRTADVTKAEMRYDTSAKAVGIFGNAFSVQATIDKERTERGNPPVFTASITISHKTSRSVIATKTIGANALAHANDVAAAVADYLKAKIQKDHPTKHDVKTTFEAADWPDTSSLLEKPAPQKSESALKPVQPLNPYDSPKTMTLNMPVTREDVGSWKMWTLDTAWVATRQEVLQNILQLLPEDRRNRIPEKLTAVRYRILDDGMEAPSRYLELIDMDKKSYFLVLDDASKEEATVQLIEMNALVEGDIVIKLPDVVTAFLEQEKGVNLYITPLKFAKIKDLPVKVAVRETTGDQLRIILIRDASAPSQAARVARNFQRHEFQVSNPFDDGSHPSAESLAAALAAEPAVTQANADDLIATLEMAAEELIKAARGEIRSPWSLRKELILLGITTLVAGGLGALYTAYHHYFSGPHRPVPAVAPLMPEAQPEKPLTKKSASGETTGARQELRASQVTVAMQAGIPQTALYVPDAQERSSTDRGYGTLKDIVREAQFASKNGISVLTKPPFFMSRWDNSSYAIFSQRLFNPALIDIDYKLELFQAMGIGADQIPGLREVIAQFADDSQKLNRLELGDAGWTQYVNRQILGVVWKWFRENQGHTGLKTLKKRYDEFLYDENEAEDEKWTDPGRKKDYTGRLDDHILGYLLIGHYSGGDANNNGWDIVNWPDEVKYFGYDHTAPGVYSEAIQNFKTKDSSEGGLKDKIEFEQFIQFLFRLELDDAVKQMDDLGVVLNDDDPVDQGGPVVAWIFPWAYGLTRENEYLSAELQGSPGDGFSPYSQWWQNRRLRLEDPEAFLLSLAFDQRNRRTIPVRRRDHAMMTSRSWLVTQDPKKNGTLEHLGLFTEIERLRDEAAAGRLSEEDAVDQFSAFLKKTFQDLKTYQDYYREHQSHHGDLAVNDPRRAFIEGLAPDALDLFMDEDGELRPLSMVFAFRPSPYEEDPRSELGDDSIWKRIGMTMDTYERGRFVPLMSGEMIVGNAKMYKRFLRGYLFPKDPNDAPKPTDIVKFGYYRYLPGLKSELVIARRAQASLQIVQHELLGSVPERMLKAYLAVQGTFSLTPVFWGHNPDLPYGYHPNVMTQGSLMIPQIQDMPGLRESIAGSLTAEQKTAILQAVLGRSAEITERDYWILPSVFKRAENIPVILEQLKAFGILERTNYDPLYGTPWFDEKAYLRTVQDLWEGPLRAGGELKTYLANLNKTLRQAKGLRQLQDAPEEVMMLKSFQFDIQKILREGFSVEEAEAFENIFLLMSFAPWLMRRDYDPDHLVRNTQTTADLRDIASLIQRFNIPGRLGQWRQRFPKWTAIETRLAATEAVIAEENGTTYTKPAEIGEEDFELAKKMVRRLRWLVKLRTQGLEDFSKLEHGKLIRTNPDLGSKFIQVAEADDPEIGNFMIDAFTAGPKDDITDIEITIFDGESDREVYRGKAEKIELENGGPVQPWRFVWKPGAEILTGAPVRYLTYQVTTRAKRSGITETDGRRGRLALVHAGADLNPLSENFVLTPLFLKLGIFRTKGLLEKIRDSAWWKKMTEHWDRVKQRAQTAWSKTTSRAEQRFEYKNLEIESKQSIPSTSGEAAGPAILTLKRDTLPQEFTDGLANNVDAARDMPEWMKARPSSVAEQIRSRQFTGAALITRWEKGSQYRILGIELQFSSYTIYLKWCSDRFDADAGTWAQFITGKGVSFDQIIEDPAVVTGFDEGNQQLTLTRYEMRDLDRMGRNKTVFELGDKTHVQRIISYEDVYGLSAYAGIHLSTENRQDMTRLLQIIRNQSPALGEVLDNTQNDLEIRPLVQTEAKGAQLPVLALQVIVTPPGQTARCIQINFLPDDRLVSRVNEKHRSNNRLLADRPGHVPWQSIYYRENNIRYNPAANTLTVPTSALPEVESTVTTTNVDQAELTAPSSESLPNQFQFFMPKSNATENDLGTGLRSFRTDRNTDAEAAVRVILQASTAGDAAEIQRILGKPDAVIRFVIFLTVSQNQQDVIVAIHTQVASDSENFAGNVFIPLVSGNTNVTQYEQQLTSNVTLPFPADGVVEGNQITIIPRQAPKPEIVPPAPVSHFAFELGESVALQGALIGWKSHVISLKNPANQAALKKLFELPHLEGGYAQRANFEMLHASLRTSEADGALHCFLVIDYKDPNKAPAAHLIRMREQINLTGTDQESGQLFNSSNVVVRAHLSSAVAVANLSLTNDSRLNFDLAPRSVAAESESAEAVGALGDERKTSNETPPTQMTDNTTSFSLPLREALSALPYAPDWQYQYVKDAAAASALLDQIRFSGSLEEGLALDSATLWVPVNGENTALLSVRTTTADQQPRTLIIPLTESAAGSAEALRTAAKLPETATVIGPVPSRPAVTVTQNANHEIEFRFAEAAKITVSQIAPPAEQGQSAEPAVLTFPLRFESMSQFASNWEYHYVDEAESTQSELTRLIGLAGINDSSDLDLRSTRLYFRDPRSYGTLSAFLVIPYRSNDEMIEVIPLTRNQQTQTLFLTNTLYLPKNLDHVHSLPLDFEIAVDLSVNQATITLTPIVPQILRFDLTDHPVSRSAQGWSFQTINPDLLQNAALAEPLQALLRATGSEADVRAIQTLSVWHRNTAGTDAYALKVETEWSKFFIPLLAGADDIASLQSITASGKSHAYMYPLKNSHVMGLALSTSTFSFTLAPGPAEKEAKQTRRPANVGRVAATDRDHLVNFQDLETDLTPYNGETTASIRFVFPATDTQDFKLKALLKILLNEQESSRFYSYHLDHSSTRFQSVELVCVRDSLTDPWRIAGFWVSLKDSFDTTRAYYLYANGQDEAAKRKWLAAEKTIPPDSEVLEVSPRVEFDPQDGKRIRILMEKAPPRGAQFATLPVPAESVASEQKVLSVEEINVPLSPDDVTPEDGVKAEDEDRPAPPSLEELRENARDKVVALTNKPDFSKTPESRAGIFEIAAKLIPNTATANWQPASADLQRIQETRPDLNKKAQTALAEAIQAVQSAIRAAGQQRKEMRNLAEDWQVLRDYFVQRFPESDGYEHLTYQQIGEPALPGAFNYNSLKQIWKRLGDEDRSTHLFIFDKAKNVYWLIQYFPGRGAVKPFIQIYQATNVNNMNRILSDLWISPVKMTVYAGYPDLNKRGWVEHYNLSPQDFDLIQLAQDPGSPLLQLAVPDSIWQSLSAAAFQDDIAGAAPYQVLDRLRDALSLEVVRRNELRTFDLSAFQEGLLSAVTGSGLKVSRVYWQQLPGKLKSRTSQEDPTIYPVYSLGRDKIYMLPVTQQHPQLEVVRVVPGDHVGAVVRITPDNLTLTLGNMSAMPDFVFSIRQNLPIATGFGGRGEIMASMPIGFFVELRHQFRPKGQEESDYDKEEALVAKFLKQMPVSFVRISNPKAQDLRWSWTRTTGTLPEAQTFETLAQRLFHERITAYVEKAAASQPAALWSWNPDTVRAAAAALKFALRAGFPLTLDFEHRPAPSSAPEGRTIMVVSPKYVPNPLGEGTSAPGGVPSLAEVKNLALKYRLFDPNSQFAYTFRVSDLLWWAQQNLPVEELERQFRARQLIRDTADQFSYRVAMPDGTLTPGALSDWADELLSGRKTIKEIEVEFYGRQPYQHSQIAAAVNLKRRWNAVTDVSVVYQRAGEYGLWDHHPYAWNLTWHDFVRWANWGYTEEELEVIFESWQTIRRIAFETRYTVRDARGQVTAEAMNYWIEQLLNQKLTADEIRDLFIANQKTAPEAYHSQYHYTLANSNVPHLLASDIPPLMSLLTEAAKRADAWEPSFPIPVQLAMSASQSAVPRDEAKFVVLDQIGIGIATEGHIHSPQIWTKDHVFSDGTDAGQEQSAQIGIIQKMLDWIRHFDLHELYIHTSVINNAAAQTGLQTVLRQWPEIMALQKRSRGPKAKVILKSDPSQPGLVIEPMAWITTPPLNDDRTISTPTKFVVREAVPADQSDSNIVINPSDLAYYKLSRLPLRREMRLPGMTPELKTAARASIDFSRRATDHVLRNELRHMLDRFGWAASQPALDVIAGMLGTPLHAVAFAAEPGAGILESRLAENPDTRARLEAGAFLEQIAQALRQDPDRVIALFSNARFVLKPVYAEALRSDPEALRNLASLLELLRGKGLETRFLTIMAKREDYLAAVARSYSGRNRLSVHDRRDVQAVIDTLRNTVNFINPDKADTTVLRNYAASEHQAGRGVAVLGDDSYAVENALNFRLAENRVPKHGLSLLLPAIICGGSLAASEAKEHSSFAEQPGLVPDLLGKIFPEADMVYQHHLWDFRNVEGYLARLLETQAVRIIDQSA